ncbi:alpha-beta hydrolase superfamily lysophospholipase [Allocatelliglobosispora scoriae]|uniref:Alpha-beta hydrolase superfamily lysophospholipase n=1 Tax=Allocatelliglobosispora scoriae TaxID=643052 RepID=A0A841BGT4_9ACTN|nr:dienelactone hydrolase family protein [Allocatelliglobosispora scoriae]MBB5868297.1 alpha-beta hydrolase superfamily lysophospholipase [Allocatelliglobosispora scoriae]
MQPSHSPTRRPLRARVLGGLALALVGTTLLASPAQAADNPYERGPAPTNASIEASQGPFATSSVNVSSTVPGFGGGVIYYPTTTTAGTFGAVAISPGYTARWSSLSWLGPRLASQGFVVIGIETNSIYDQPASRGDQLLAALDYLVNSSSVRTRVDGTRLAVAGHSMGGGGTLEAAKDRPSLQAAVPLAPWNLTKSWTSLQVPTLIFGGESDTVAPVSSHSEPFYNSIPSASEKAYIELNNASHFFPQTPNTTVAKYAISWLKRFVDNDTRYEQFICPLPSSSAIEESRGTCPYIS